MILPLVLALGLLVSIKTVFSFSFSFDFDFDFAVTVTVAAAFSFSLGFLGDIGFALDGPFDGAAGLILDADADADADVEAAAAFRGGGLRVGVVLALGLRIDKGLVAMGKRVGDVEFCSWS